MPYLYSKAEAPSLEELSNSLPKQINLKDCIEESWKKGELKVDTKTVGRVITAVVVGAIASKMGMFDVDQVHALENSVGQNYSPLDADFPPDGVWARGLSMDVYKSMHRSPIDGSFLNPPVGRFDHLNSDGTITGRYMWPAANDTLICSETTGGPKASNCDEDGYVKAGTPLYYRIGGTGK